MPPDEREGIPYPQATHDTPALVRWFTTAEVGTLTRWERLVLAWKRWTAWRRR